MFRTMKNSPGCSKVPCTAKDGTGAEQCVADALQIKTEYGQMQYLYAEF
jgi:hypothetical protein